MNKRESIFADRVWMKLAREGSALREDDVREVLAAASQLDRLTPGERVYLNSLRLMSPMPDQVSFALSVIDRLSPDRRKAKRDPVAALLKEWFGDGTSDSYIAELKRQLEAALNQEKDNA